MAQKSKKVCLSCFISQETYIIWFSFMVHITCIKWYLELSSSFYQICDFLGCYGNKRAKNGLKWEKIPCHTPYIRDHTSYDFHLCIYGTNDNISRIFYFILFFLILSKFWLFQCLRREQGSKGQKTVHKNLCTLHLISKEPYIICLSFVVHKCKLMISPGSKRAKKSPKWEKILPVELHISGTVHHMIVIRGRHMYNISRVFFSLFQNFDILVC